MNAEGQGEEVKGSGAKTGNVVVCNKLIGGISNVICFSKYIQHLAKKCFFYVMHCSLNPKYF